MACVWSVSTCSRMGERQCIDANSGFWQIPLSEGSQKLTTFITLFGRLSLQWTSIGHPFSSGTLSKADGNHIERSSRSRLSHERCYLWESTQEKHNSRPRHVLSRLGKVGVIFNAEEFLFNVKELMFLAHQNHHQRMQPDHEKVKAVKEMLPPNTRPELQEASEMATCLSRVVPNCLVLLQPLM